MIISIIQHVVLQELADTDEQLSSPMTLMEVHACAFLSPCTNGDMCSLRNCLISHAMLA